MKMTNTERNEFQQQLQNAETELQAGISDLMDGFDLGSVKEPSKDIVVDEDLGDEEEDD